MNVTIKETGETKQLTYWVAGGQNNAAEVVIQNAPESDLTVNEAGEYVMDQTSYDWWQEYLNRLQDLDRLIEHYKGTYPDEDVDWVLQNRMYSYEFNDLPDASIMALQEAFNHPGDVAYWPDVLGNYGSADTIMTSYEDDAERENIALADWIRRLCISLRGMDGSVGTNWDAIARSLTSDAESERERQADPD